MSNKTEIQSLNAKYSELIESLRGKAVGGGGSAETCTVTFTGWTFDEAFYVLNNAVVSITDCIDTSVEVQKNTILYATAEENFNFSLSGDITALWKTHTVLVATINGDCAIIEIN